MDINSTVVSGRLTRDPEVAYTKSGMAVAKISIANEWQKKVNDSWDKQTNFFDVVIWGKPAEWLQKDLSKGNALTIQGELRQERWEKDGQKQSRVVINADKVSYQRQGGERVEYETPTENAAKNFDDDIPF